MDLINGELELFFMKDGETVQEMYDRLMVLVSDIRALGSKDWDDSKVTKKLLRAFAHKDKNLMAMIRRDPIIPNNDTQTTSWRNLVPGASWPRYGEVPNLEDEQDFGPQC
jgi:hypothetical protein